MDALIQAMSNEDLQALAKQHKDNADIATMISGILEVRQAEANKAKALEVFEAKMLKLAKLPTPPEGILNVHMRWAEVEVEDQTAEAELVDIIVTPAVMGEGGTITTAAVVEQQPRFPTHKVFQWIVETNKGFANSGTGTKTGKSKRAILVEKRDGNTIVPVGNFRCGAKAAEHLNILVGGASANAKLKENGYLVTPLADIEGVNFLA